MAEASIASVVVPRGGIAHEFRATMVVWQREMIRFQRDPARIISSFVQPLLFLFVLGGGLSALVASGAGGLDFKTFL
jgi:ABC-2 type transport system permease protein